MHGASLDRVITDRTLPDWVRAAAEDALREITYLHEVQRRSTDVRCAGGPGFLLSREVPEYMMHVEGLNSCLDNGP